MTKNKRIEGKRYFDWEPKKKFKTTEMLSFYRIDYNS